MHVIGWYKFCVEKSQIRTAVSILVCFGKIGYCAKYFQELGFLISMVSNIITHSSRYSQKPRTVSSFGNQTAAVFNVEDNLKVYFVSVRLSKLLPLHCSKASSTIFATLIIFSSSQTLPTSCIPTGAP